MGKAVVRCLIYGDWATPPAERKSTHFPHSSSEFWSTRRLRLLRHQNSPPSLLQCPDLLRNTNESLEEVRYDFKGGLKVLYMLIGGRSCDNHISV